VLHVRKVVIDYDKIDLLAFKQVLKRLGTLPSVGQPVEFQFERIVRDDLNSNFSYLISDETAFQKSSQQIGLMLFDSFFTEHYKITAREQPDFDRRRAFVFDLVPKTNNLCRVKVKTSLWINLKDHSRMPLSIPKSAIQSKEEEALYKSLGLIK